MAAVFNPPFQLLVQLSLNFHFQMITRWTLFGSLLAILPLGLTEFCGNNKIPYGLEVVILVYKKKSKGEFRCTKAEH